MAWARVSLGEEAWLRQERKKKINVARGLRVRAAWDKRRPNQAKVLQTVLVIWVFSLRNGKSLKYFNQRERFDHICVATNGGEQEWIGDGSTYKNEST